ncbi:D-arabinono-1,4-lactone oxidase-domain-containing protein [Lipomyces oligophaga]|uniref:D-arabinono-1,4-lactone oxidase-domain-containing protein n=1 Tax=Lipomyces oligophaga TaxID=45792 RepID=UPI0034CEFF80
MASDLPLSVVSAEPSKSATTLSQLSAVPCAHTHVHSTWARTFVCRPSLYLQPKSIDELVDIVNEARISRKTITVVGSGHSPSDITMVSPGGWIVNLDNLNSVLSFQPGPSSFDDPSKVVYTDVRVEAGIRVYELHAALAAKGLALQNLGSISEQSVAGLISTGTHGSSAFHGPLAQQVVNITLLTASGSLRTISPNEEPLLFRAALLSLGKLGIVTHLTFRVIPSFTIHSVQEIIDFDRLLQDWQSLWTSKEYVRVWWFPYSRKCVLWRAEKSDKSLSKPRFSFYGTWLGRKLYELMLWFAVKIYPPAMPSVERFVFNRQYGSTQTYDTTGPALDEAVQNSVEGLNMDCLFRQFVNEWGVPLRDGIEILQKIDDIVSAASKKREYYVHAPIEVRVSNCSVPDPKLATTLSPLTIRDANNGVGAIPGNLVRPLLDYAPSILPNPDFTKPVSVNDLTLYINATMYRPFGLSPPIGQWYSEFEEIMANYSGRPHWAKNFIGPAGPELTAQEEKKPKADGQMVGIAGVFEKWYGDDGMLFKKLRQDLDPAGVFIGGKDWSVRNGIL